MTTYKDKANQMADMLNVMTFNDKEFCKEMTNQHRTLQQSFTRLCLEWLKTCASEDYRHDGRNETSHWIAKELKDAYDNNHTQTSVEFFNDIYLPMI